MKPKIPKKPLKDSAMARPSMPQTHAQKQYGKNLKENQPYDLVGTRPYRLKYGQFALALGQDQREEHEGGGHRGQ